MSPKQAIHDPVFQLNLLVWMAKAQPPDRFRVRPLFSEHGFEIHIIEHPFPFPTEMRREIALTAANSGLEVKLEPEPELIIRRHTDQHAVYFEAKAHGFSPTSSNCKQARGHLLACGPAFAEVYKPLSTAFLDYVVPLDDSADMRVCLKELKAELSAVKLEAGNYAVDGLSIKETNLFYHLDVPIRHLLSDAESEIAVMVGLDEETDPSPLLLVYSDEDCPDLARQGHYRRVLQNQCLANLLCILHSKSPGQVVEISAQELLLQTTNDVFSFLGRERQKRMVRLIVKNVYRRVHEYWKEKLPNKVRLDGKTLILDFSILTDREGILDWLEDAKRSGFEDKMPTDDCQELLFPLDPF